MPKKLTYDYVKKYIEGEGYKLLSTEYENNRTKLLLECPKGHKYLATFGKFKAGRRCSVCNKEHIRKRKTLSYGKVKNFIEQNNYKLLSTEYKNAHELLTMKCPNNHIVEINFNNFKNGKRCPECYKEERLLNLDKVKKRIEDEGHKLLSTEYINSSEELEIQCPKGHIYKRSYDYFRTNHRCTKCLEENIEFKRNKRYIAIKEYIEKEGYVLLSKEYKNNKQSILIKCDKGHIYETCFDNFQQGCRCPNCNSSKGNKEINDILIKLNINFFSEYKFKNCKFKRKLPFDFYLPDYNCCIEFDGIQHYKIIKHFGGYDAFITRKIKDTIKNEYCKNNNIKLIRIPYWEINNIEEILIKELNIKIEKAFND